MVLKSSERLNNWGNQVIRNYSVDGKMLTDAYWCLDAYWYFVMYTIKMLTDTKRYIFDVLYIYDLPMTSNKCKQMLLDLNPN